MLVIRQLSPLESSLRILVKGSSSLSGVVVATTVGVFVGELARITVAVSSPRVPGSIHAGIGISDQEIGHPLHHTYVFSRNEESA